MHLFLCVVAAVIPFEGGGDDDKVDQCDQVIVLRDERTK